MARRAIFAAIVATLVSNERKRAEHFTADAHAAVDRNAFQGQLGCDRDVRGRLHADPKQRFVGVTLAFEEFEKSAEHRFGTIPNRKSDTSPEPSIPQLSPTSPTSPCQRAAANATHASHFGVRGMRELSSADDSSSKAGQFYKSEQRVSEFEPTSREGPTRSQLPIAESLQIPPATHDKDE
jgi:hypothetical protein